MNTKKARTIRLSMNEEELEFLLNNLEDNSKGLEGLEMYNKIQKKLKKKLIDLRE